MEDINIKKVIIAALITLALLFLGNYLITDYRIDRQLKKELLKLSQVKEVKINQAKKYHLNLLLVEIDDLAALNLKLRTKIEEILATDDYKLELYGKESTKLKEIYKRINLALYESLVTGKYTTFGKTVEEYKEQYNLEEAEVKVDNKYIYLTLVDNRGAIYKVLTRSRAKVGEEDG